MGFGPIFKPSRAQSVAVGVDGAWTMPAGADEGEWLVGGRATYAVQETFTLLPRWWWGVSVAGHGHLDSDRARLSGAGMVGYAPVGIELGGYADLQGDATHGGAFVGLGLTIGVASLYARQGVYASGGGTFTDLGIRLQYPFVWKKKKPSWLGKMVSAYRRGQRKRRGEARRKTRMAFARGVELTGWKIDELHRRPAPTTGPQRAWQIPTARVRIAAPASPGSGATRMDVQVQGWAPVDWRIPQDASSRPYERVVLGKKSVVVSAGQEVEAIMALKPNHEAKQGDPVTVDRWMIIVAWQAQGMGYRVWVSDPSVCANLPRQGRAMFYISPRETPELCQPLAAPKGDFERLKKMFFWEPEDVSP